MLIYFQAWQWQVGVITVLLFGMHTINAINKIPTCSAFLPITTKFLKSFLKIFCYVVSIVLLYGTVFYLTLNPLKAFESLPQAMIKTTVWLLGDLAYDDTFLEENLLYPWLSKIIFIVFATSVAAFIANLLISNPTRFIEEYSEFAEWNKYRLTAEMFLDFDICFPWIRRCFIRSHIVVPKAKQDPSDIIKEENLLKADSDCVHKDNIESRLTKLEDLVSEIKLQNDLILQLHKIKET